MQILLPHCRVLVASKADFDQAQKENYPEIFMLTSDGVYKHQRLGPADSGRYVCAKVPAVPGFELMTPPKQEFKFLPDGKVPGELFDQIVGLYREVMRVNNGRNLEAMAWILWNQDDGYFIHVPKQQVSGASVNYEWDIPAGSIVVVDTHSHNSMGAFFSGTDDGDDRRGVRISGVVGKLTNTNFETCWRFCYQGKFTDMKFDDIFMPSRAEVNPAWLGKIETQTYHGYSGYGYGTGGSYHGRSGNGSNSTHGRTTGHTPPNGAGSGQRNGVVVAGGGKPTPHENDPSFDAQYEEYYNRMNGQHLAEANQTTTRRTPTPTGRPVYDQRARTATTIDPSAPHDFDRTRFNTEARNEAKVQENLGNAVAGTPTTSAVTVVPAKEGKPVIVGADGRPLQNETNTPTKPALPSVASLLEKMDQNHGGAAGKEVAASTETPAPSSVDPWSAFPKSSSFVDGGTDGLVPLGSAKTSDPEGKLSVREILDKIPHELSEEQADEILRQMAQNATLEMGGFGFDIEGLVEAGFLNPQSAMYLNDSVVDPDLSDDPEDDLNGAKGVDGINISGFEHHPRFQEIAINYGPGVANAFCLINELSVEFSTGDCDDLVSEIVGDFFQFLTDPTALKLFRQLYSYLSEKNQEDVGTKGL